MLKPQSLLNNHRLALLETALAISLWALSFIFIKIALFEVSVISLITLRFGIGAIILSLVLFRRDEHRGINLDLLLRMAVLGIIGITFQQLLQVSGQVTADASVAAFLASTAPAFLVILAAVFLRESLNIWQVLGVLLATLGATVIAVGGGWQEVAKGRIDNPGNLLVLASAVMWAVFSILNRKLAKGYPPVIISTGMLFFGFFVMLPIFLLNRGWQEFYALSSETWFALLFLGGFCTAGAFLLYTHALKLEEASRLAAIQNIEPVIAVTAAVIILNETISDVLIFGGAAIIIGVYLAERFAPGRLKSINQFVYNKSK
ncbi:MAG: DMT family transporter [Anaerolineales bacterium]|nr:DMT family transporter [Anaerolineales bacterium]